MPNYILLEILVLHYFIVFRLASLERITAIESLGASLPCSAALGTDEGLHPTLLRWFQERHHKPAYTLDVRLVVSEGSAWTGNGSRHFPSDEFEGRLYLDLDQRVPVLRIDPVLFADRGRYSCRIDFKAIRSVQSDVDLDVIVPPKGVVIRDLYGRHVDGVIGPFHLGESLVISCESLGGYPVSSLTWSGDFNHSSSSIEIVTSFNKSSIVIKSLSREYQWRHFTCTAKNNNITSPKSATATIEINLPPMDIILESKEPEPFRHGDVVTISCLGIGSHPRSHARWTFDGHPVISKDSVLDNGNITKSIYQRTILANDDSKVIECTMYNPIVPSQTLKRTLTLKVKYKPQLRLSIESRRTGNDAILEGDSISIRCETRSNPPASGIVWYRDGLALSDPSISAVQDAGDLFLPEVERRHGGNYTCESSNSEGISLASILLDVKHPPICQRIELAAEKGRVTANVTCNLLANPRDVTFYWMALYQARNHSWTTGGDSKSVVRLDANLTGIACWGRNSVGLQGVPCTHEWERDIQFTIHSTDIAYLCLGVAVCFAILILLCRKLCEDNKPDPNVRLTNARSMKDNGCSQLINNCVKSTSSLGESECLNNLLTPQQIRKSTDSQATEKYMQTDKQGAVQLRNQAHQKNRRIQSSQF